MSNGPAARPTPRRRRVALVMPVRNEEDAVDATMAAVFNSTRLPDEIIVADALSSDATVDRLRPWQQRGVPLKVVRNSTIYCGGGRNVAARHSSCDVIVIVDFGNPVFPGYIEEMVRPFEEQDGIDVTMGILLPLMHTPFEHCMGTIYYDENILLRDYSLAQKQALLPAVLLPGGGCIAMTRSFLDRMGGYPEWLARSQDRLFSRKAHGLGVRIAVAWDAYCYNHVRSNPWQVWRMAYGWARCNGQSRYLRKHLLKALPFYGLIAGLLAWSPAQPLAALAALGLFMAYTARAGYRRLLRVDGGLRDVSYLWHVPALLAAGDLATIAGHAVGWFEWCSRPELRRAYYAYVEGCPPALLPVVER